MALFIFLFFWSKSRSPLESITDQSSESSANQLLKAMLDLNFQEAHFGYVIPFIGLSLPGSLIPCRRSSSFIFSEEPYVITKQAKWQNMGRPYHHISLRANIFCSFLRFLIWYLISLSDNLKMLNNHYQNGIFITSNYETQRFITAKINNKENAVLKNRSEPGGKTWGDLRH